MFKSNQSILGLFITFIIGSVFAQPQYETLKVECRLKVSKEDFDVRPPNTYHYVAERYFTIIGKFDSNKPKELKYLNVEGWYNELPPIKFSRISKRYRRRYEVQLPSLNKEQSIKFLSLIDTYKNVPNTAEVFNGNTQGISFPPARTRKGKKIPAAYGGGRKDVKSAFSHYTIDASHLGNGDFYQLALFCERKYIIQ